MELLLNQSFKGFMLIKSLIKIRFEKLIKNMVVIFLKHDGTPFSPGLSKMVWQFTPGKNYSRFLAFHQLFYRQDCISTIERKTSFFSERNQHLPFGMLVFL
jgi:hypothetical protein